MLEMEVDKDIIFSLAELGNSEQLPPPDFMWCWNDLQTIQTCPRAEFD
jgi:hypothetical protein